MVNNNDDWEDLPIDQGVDDWEDAIEAPEEPKNVQGGAFLSNEEGRTINDDIARVATKHNVDPETLRNYTVYTGYTGVDTETGLSDIPGRMAGNISETYLGGAGAWAYKKAQDEKTEQAIDELEQILEDRKSGLQKVKEFAGSVVAPGGVAKKIGTATKGALAAQGALNVGESAAYGVFGSKSGNEVEAGLTGGAIGAIVPTVGGLIGAGKRLLPGTTKSLPWINKRAAEAGSIMPGTPTKQKLLDIFSDPKLRRESAEMTEEAYEKSLMNAAETVDEAREGLQKEAGRRYETGKAQFIEDSIQASGTAGALEGKVQSHWLQNLSSKMDQVDANPQFYSKSTKDLIKKVKEVLQGQGPNVGKDTLPEKMLSVRNYIDEINKKKKKKLTKDDIALLNKLRNRTDESIRHLSSGNTLKNADADYKEAQEFQDYLKSFKKKANDRASSPTKMEQILKRGGIAGREAKEQVGGFGAYVKGLRGSTSQRTGKEAVDSLQDIHEVITQRKLRKDIEGGLTGVIGNMITGAGHLTTGLWSALALPITNPDLYLKIIDSGAGTYFKKAYTFFAEKGIVKATAMKQAHDLAMANDPKYKEALQSPQEKAKEQKEEAKQAWMNK